MQVVNSSITFNLDWFNHKGPYLIPKKGYQSMIVEAVRGKKMQDTESASSVAENGSKSEPAVQLSKEQIKKLAQQYNPRQMSEDEYRSFIDELCQLGVLEEKDKPYLFCGAYGNLNLIPLDAYGSSISVTPATFQDNCSFDFSFFSCKGNVIDWAGYLSSFRKLNPYTHTFDEKTKSAILFEKVTDVLEKIQNQ